MHHIKQMVGYKLFVLLLFVLVLIEGGVLHSMDSWIDPCKSGAYLTIDSLYDYCKIPGDCSRKIESEGKTALIKGYIDYVNVYDKTNYPNLPYQKFLITNDKRNKTMEVWVRPESSEGVFEKIFRQKKFNPDSPVFVTGILVGFDMPMMGACHRGLKLDLTGESALMFHPNDAE